MKRTRLLAVVALGIFLFVTACYAGPTVYVVRKPPPLRVEVISVAPSPSHVWIAGHWGWQGGDYQWVPGHWAVRPHACAVWAPDHWKHTRRGYVWIPGHWR